MKAVLSLIAGLIGVGSTAFAQNPDFHVFLCFGQSNMEGFPGIEEQDRTGVDERFRMLAAVDFTEPARTKGEWYPANPPLSRPRTGLGPADYFGRTLVAKLPANIRVGVINVSVAGCKIELFDKDNFQSYAARAPNWMTNIINTYGGNPYAHLVAMGRRAQQQGVIKGILLHQGESNTNDREWPNKVKVIYENLLADLNLKAEDVPLLAGELVHADQNGACASMNAIIGELPNAIPTAHVISSAGCESRRDRLHFTPAGYRELGRRYGNRMLQLMGHETALQPDADGRRAPASGSIAPRDESADAAVRDLSGSGPAAMSDPARIHFGAVAPLLDKYCVDCHGGAEPENDLSLEFTDAQAVGRKLMEDHRLFEHMADRIRSGEMPPKKKRRPTEAEKDLLLSWIDQELVAALGSRPFGQVARVRRLTRVEYANTIRDLFYFDDFQAGDLPPDDIGYGFDSIADLLTVSPGHLDLYLSTAERAMAQLDATAKVSPNWAEKDGTYWEPDDGVFLPIRDVKLGFNNNQDRVRLVLEKFLPRAYRRPVTDEEIDRLMIFARLSLTQEGESFIRPKSTYATLRAALSSPYFLYRIEQDPPAGIAPINEYELASRLSYFLWSSMPDDELFSLARQNQLRARQEEQVRRMLKDPKARALTENFAEQWLHLGGLDKAAPDPKLYPDYDEALRQAMREETRRFVAHVIGEDRSIMEFLDADYTFLNERLARHYGIEDVTGDEFRQVRLGKRRQRGGLMTQASILTLTSPPTRTSPVKRGVWVLETLFNDPPSPPPAEVPPLEEEGTVLTGSVRQVLEQHRENAQCAGCHNRIDPYGLALENYNAIGAWRAREGRRAIDSSGTLPDGTAFKNVTQFRALLNGKQAVFRQALVEKLLIYALGRGLEYADARAVREICARVERQGDRFSSVILAIVESDLFQKRQAPEPTNLQAKGE